jgi:hypothetical protein
MSYLRRFLVSFVGLACLMQLAFVTPTSAQSAKTLEQERFSRVMDPTTDVEEFREEFTNYFTELEQIMELFSKISVVRKKLIKNGLKPLETIAQAKLSIANATPEDLRLLRITYAKFPGWRDTPRSLTALIKPQFHQQLELRLTNQKRGEPVLNAETEDDCEDGLSADISNTDISIAKGVEIGLVSVMEGFPTDALTIAARIAPIAAVAVAQAATLTLETLKAIKDDCNGDTFESAIQSQVTTSTNTIKTHVTTNANTIVSNDNTNTTTILNKVELAKTVIADKIDANATAIINNDNANTLALTNLVNTALTTIINNANANKEELKNMLLRTQIEAALATPDSSSFVALYQTASTTCTASFATPVTQCGYLDLVRIIVSETIANIGSGTNALTFLAAGDADRAAGRFKAAYANYQKAYKAAAK